MVGKRRDTAPEPRVEEDAVEPVTEPGGETTVVSDPDADPGPGDNAGDPTQVDYTGPGTYVPRSERLDWPDDSVCYLGQYSIREITAADFKSLGVEDQPTMRWDATNRHAISKDAFTEAALRALQQTGEFKIT